MTSRETGPVANFANIAYDSGKDASTGRKRVGISATEIELLDDIPPLAKTDVTDSRSNVEIVSSSAANGRQKQQNNYQTLSLNRGSTNPNVVYQDENNPQVHSAFDKLIEKYAPDAIPSNLSNGSHNQRSPPQATASSSSTANSRDATVFSTFQTASPPSSTASHNYSTVVRPSNKQTSQLPTQSKNNTSMNTDQTSARRQPASAYDSFQHVSPPTQNPQSQQVPFQSSIPVQTQNGNFAQVVPGKLYSLNDDPLHLLYDRQNPVQPKQQQQQTTFQPSMNLPGGPNPSTVLYTNTNQRIPLQSVPITANNQFTTNPNPPGVSQFDLGNLIKRVQQDYLREIQPFVSSVKFVEKDHEYGQSLVDIGFTTPVTVRRGFRTQADDILRRSFGRQDRPQHPARNYDDEENTYSESDSESYDDDISDLRPSIRREKLDTKFSKESITSVTSVTSATDSEYGDRKLRKKKKFHTQGTSPPPQRIPVKTEPAQNQPAAVVTNLPKADESDDEKEESTIAAPQKPVVKEAKRLPSDSTDSETSDDANASLSEYNKHESTAPPRANPSETITSFVTSIPTTRPSDETTRERGKIAGAPGIQRSEDIHPTPPTIRPGQPTARTQPKKSDTDRSDTVSTASDSAASDDDDGSVTYNGQKQASSTFQPNNARTPGEIPGGRGPQTTPAPSSSTPAAAGNARFPPGQNPATTAPANSRDAPAPSSTTAAANNARLLPGQNPTTTARTTAENPGKQQDPNIHFVPQDQRATGNQRTGPTSTPTATTAGPAQTGSTRFFQTDNDAKSGGKRSLKEMPASIGDKFKSLFRRK